MIRKVAGYLSGLPQIGHFVRVLVLRKPSIFLQLLQMKWPFSQVLPLLSSFSLPQASQVRFMVFGLLGLTEFNWQWKLPERLGPRIQNEC
jgi:hypothetical protein